jgi:predicted N-acetyltransferase YhbS
MPTNTEPQLVVRAATAADADTCGRICYEAFAAISNAHGFPCDLPGTEAGTELLRMMFSNPTFYAVVAESNGRTVGSNVLLEQCPIQGIGPLTIDPKSQNVGLGRTLMLAVMNRAQQNGASGLRLVQAAYHNRSLALYTSLGFDIREPLSCLQGKTRERNVAGCVVRQAKLGDEATCNELSRRIHGFDRGAELTQAIQQGTAQVVERGDRITGYTTNLGLFGHSTTETNVDMQALLTSAESFAGPGVLVPSRNSALMRWCLMNGLRVVQPMTLMTTGLYNDPAGSWLPSIFF